MGCPATAFFLFPLEAAFTAQLHFPSLHFIVQTGIFGFISFDILFIVGGLDPWTFLDDPSFLFIFRLAIAVFFNCPVSDVSIAGFYVLPDYTPWLIMPPFGGAARRLREAGRRLDAGDGMSVRVNVVTNRDGGTDTTASAMDKLMSADAASMLASFLSNPMTTSKGIGAEDVSVDTSRSSYVNNNPGNDGLGSSDSGTSGSISAGGIAGIVIGVLAAVVLAAAGVAAVARRNANNANNNAGPTPATERSTAATAPTPATATAGGVPVAVDTPAAEASGVTTLDAEPPAGPAGRSLPTRQELVIPEEGSSV